MCSLSPIYLKVPSLKLFFKHQSFHSRVTSDIPGNPHAFDNELISLFNTLPEPSNFNMVWTNVEYTEPIVVRGQLPLARINSLSAYCRQDGSTIPVSIDLATVADGKGRFEVVIAPSSADPTAFKKGIPVLSTGTWERGFVCMRNYVVPAGSVVATPEIIRLSDGAKLRRSESLIAGPANLENVFHSKTLRRQLGRCLLGFISFLINVYSTCKGFVCDIDHLLHECVLAAAVILAAILLSKIWSQVMFILGKRRLDKQTRFCSKLHEFYLPSQAEAEAGSQPCTLHMYWIMKYDVPAGASLSLKTIINPSDQKYWFVFHTKHRYMILLKCHFFIDSSFYY